MLAVKRLEGGTGNFQHKYTDTFIDKLSSATADNLPVKNRRQCSQKQDVDGRLGDDRDRTIHVKPGSIPETTVAEYRQIQCGKRAAQIVETQDIEDAALLG